jgi:hypothetical protein
LTELSATEPEDRMIITPALRRVASTRYQSQLLVLMPFAEELRPLYADHVKVVAERLKLTIARADDFFTTEHIHYEFTPRGMKAFEEALKKTIETIRADPETFKTRG